MILSFISSQELTGLVLLELCRLPLMHCRKVGMLTKSSQMGGFNIYIFSPLHFMKVRALSHILSLQILIFLKGTFSLAPPPPHFFFFFEYPIHHLNLIVFAGRATLAQALQHPSDSAPPFVVGGRLFLLLRIHL